MREMVTTFIRHNVIKLVDENKISRDKKNSRLLTNREKKTTWTIALCFTNEL